MVSGDAVKVAEMMPVLRLWGPTVVVAGDQPGLAQIMKLTNNIWQRSDWWRPARR